MFILCVKSSHSIGMGHLFRMINLYGALRQRGVVVTMALLGEHLPSSEWLERAGIPFEVIADQAVGLFGWEAELALRHGARVWVNDRLNTDIDHASCIKGLGLSLVTFDDLGSGAALADINVAALAGVRRETPQGTKVLMGLNFLMLPPEIARFRRRRTSSNSWVVSLGGSDTYGVTVKVAQWLSKRQQSATLVLGPGFGHEDALAKVLKTGFTIKRSVPSLVEEFAAHDLAITGGGITAFEAAAAGLPSVTVANELWEVAHCRYLQTLGASIFAGTPERIDFGLFDGRLDIEKMSISALQAVDMDGANRVSCELISLLQ